jgi:O-antigen/teichoic acid export membrane protein
MNRHLQNIFTGVVTQVVAQGFSTLSSILSVPLLLKAVGQETYGLYLVLLSITNYYGLAQFGFTSSLRNAVTFHDSQGHHERANQVINGCFAFFSLMFLAIFGLVAFLLSIEHTPLLLLLKQDQGRIADARTILLFLSFFQLFNVFVVSLLNNIFGGLRRLPKLNLIDCLMTLLSTPIYLGFLLLKPSIVSVVLFMIGQSLVRTVILVRELRREFPWIQLNLSFSNLKHVSEIKASSLHFLVTSLLAAIIVANDNMLISYFFGTAAVFTYAMLFRLFRELSNPFPVAHNAWSEASHIHASGSKEDLQSLYRKVLRLNL